MNQPSIAESASITPINVLNVVVLDTETTGLNTTRDRLIQIGAVRIVRGNIDLDETFDTLVNPGVSIPEKSSEIHGLTDADVINARSYLDIKTEFEEWIGSAIIIGYSIRFDLANLAWAPHLRG